MEYSCTGNDRGGPVWPPESPMPPLFPGTFGVIPGSRCVCPLSTTGPESQDMRNPGLC